MCIITETIGKRANLHNLDAIQTLSLTAFEQFMGQCPLRCLQLARLQGFP